MNLYTLPTSLTIGGVGFPIRSQFPAVLDILIAFNDPELDDYGKAMVMLQILFPNWRDIPPDNIDEALEKAVEFIDCGTQDPGKRSPKLIDWEQDSGIIIPAINKVAGKEVRADPNMHWWTFVGYFSEIGEGTLAYVVNIRNKRAKGKKLEKWEREYYSENKKMIDFHRKEHGNTEDQKNELRALFGLNPK
jgi:hypothetical protein